MSTEKPDEVHIDVVDGALQIRVPLELLVFASERASFMHALRDVEADQPDMRFKITDPELFARNMGHALLMDHGEDGDALIYEVLDDAAEAVVDSEITTGWVWPAAGFGSTDN